MADVICSADVLRAIPLFSRVDERHLAAVLPHVRRHRYPARAIVLRAGEPVAGLYIVLYGILSVSQESEDGARFIEALLGPGAHFGELALVEGASETSTVEAQTDCELLFVPRRNLTRLLQDEPRVAFSLLDMALTRLAGAHSTLERLGLRRVSDRVAHVLLHAVPRVGGELRIELSARRIGEMVGASREMTSRVIGRMIRAGVIRRQGNALVVLDPAALAVRSMCAQPVQRCSTSRHETRPMRLPSPTVA